MNCLQYGFSDAYQWQTHQTVLEYGYKQGEEGLKKAAKYVAPGEYDVSIDPYSDTEFNPLAGENGTVNLNAKDYMVKGQFRADKFYHATWHEGTHYNMVNSAFANRANSAPGATSGTWWDHLSPQNRGAHQGAQELLANQKAMSNPYYKYWGEDTHSFITQNLRKAEQGNLNMVNEYQSWGVLVMKLFFWFFGLVMMVLIGCMAPQKHSEQICESLQKNGKLCLEYSMCFRDGMFFPCDLDSILYAEILDHFNVSDFQVTSITYGIYRGKICTSSNGVTCDSLFVRTRQDTLKFWPPNGYYYYYDPKKRTSVKVGDWFQ